MDHFIRTLLALIITLTITTVSNAETGADKKNAQTFGSSGRDAGNVRLVRRYVPQFIGKREQESTATDLTNTADNSIERTVGDTNESENEFLELLRQYEQYNLEKQLQGGELDNNSDESESVAQMDYYEDEVNDFSGDMDNKASETQEEKRYVPSFVGKRYQPTFVGKRYQPMFVGKRSRQYQPMFVGKRYQPMFVGKRYQPMFVGKRYQPMFVGKRYQPMFVGKRYQPMFVGKRYQPTSVGKRYQPMFVGKRYVPSFVGKRYQPMFVGKRYQPFFVGKKDRSIPMFIGKKDSDSLLGNELDAENTPVLLEKRSITNTAETMSATADNSEAVKERRKRSLYDPDENEFKRSWGKGRYLPMQDLPQRLESPIAKRRFVPPEFIGRRDSISSILSALKNFKYKSSERRLASKRFQAPLFIGKRSMDRDSLYWDAYDLSPLSDSHFEQGAPTFGVIH